MLLRKSQAIPNATIKQFNNPLLWSLQLLALAISFWNKDHNKDGLDERANFNKDRFEMKDKREENMGVIYDHIAQLTAIDLMAIDNDKSDEKKRVETVKQMFYLNVYNSIVLIKMAELITYTKKEISKLKNHSSWLALEQTSAIDILQTRFTAYQLRYDVLKNVGRKPTDLFHVEAAFVHPLIDYAFFSPQ